MGFALETIVLNCFIIQLYLWGSNSYKYQSDNRLSTFEKQPQDIDNFKTGVEAAYNKRGNLELMQLKKSLTKHFISDYIARMDDKRNSLNSK